MGRVPSYWSEPLWQALPASGRYVSGCRRCVCKRSASRLNGPEAIRKTSQCYCETTKLRRAISPVPVSGPSVPATVASLHAQRAADSANSLPIRLPDDVSPNFASRGVYRKTYCPWALGWPCHPDHNSLHKNTNGPMLTFWQPLAHQQPADNFHDRSRLRICVVFTAGTFRPSLLVPPPPLQPEPSPDRDFSRFVAPKADHPSVILSCHTTILSGATSIALCKGVAPARILSTLLTSHERR